MPIRHNQVHLSSPTGAYVLYQVLNTVVSKKRALSPRLKLLSQGLVEAADGARLTILLTFTCASSARTDLPV